VKEEKREEKKALWDDFPPPEPEPKENPPGRDGSEPEDPELRGFAFGLGFSVPAR
jgi:hypothetical protein